MKAAASTTEMQVTSIRFERVLIDRLKALAGEQGYQALVREVLWDYVNQEGNLEEKIQPTEIRSVVSAIAHCEDLCAVTGVTIEVGEEMALAFLKDGRWVPICWAAIDHPRS